MKDFSNASFPPDTIGIMKIALDGAIATLPDPVSSARSVRNAQARVWHTVGQIWCPRTRNQIHSNGARFDQARLRSSAPELSHLPASPKEPHQFNASASRATVLNDVAAVSIRRTLLNHHRLLAQT